MTTGYYLLDHINPNAADRGDGRYWGYATMLQTPRVIVVHTTESLADLNGPDSGAENVANWFATNNPPPEGRGSYHTLVDSDTTVRCLPAGLDGTTPHTAFHAAGCNSFSLGLSMAVQAHTWPDLPALWVVRVLNAAAAEAALWCARWDIPPVLITRTEAANGAKGILGHGMWDPGSRSDPGAGFAWTDFLNRVRGGRVSPPQPTIEEDLMLYAFKLPNDDTIWVRNPAKGTVQTVNELAPDGADPLATYNELVASGMCRPWLQIGWNANWAIAKADGRV